MLFPFEVVKSAWAGSVVYPPGGRFGPRIQQDIQLVMLYTGEMNVMIDDRELHVEPGNVLLLKPGHEETFVFSKTEETWHRWIAVHVHHLDSDLQERLYKLPELLPLTEDINRLIDLMLNIQRDALPVDPVLLSLGMTAIHLYPTQTLTANRQLEKHPAVYSTLSWIQKHYSEEISLTNLSVQAGVSPEHLVRLFKQSEGYPPIHYLWNYRVNKAIELLTNTGLTITEIAHSCGFKTSHHLSRLIKQSSGRTATDIRLMSWSGLRKDKQ
nr:AraC family transcriptional regulator [Paenibacillus sp. Marseille-Q4541]